MLSCGACGGGPRALAVDEQDGGLLLVAGTFERTCEDVTAIRFECGRWELFVHLDPPAQTPGPKPLFSADTWAQSYLSDGQENATECTVWGGSFEQGTVEITSTNEHSIAFTIAGTATSNFDADGSYEADRCEAL